MEGVPPSFMEDDVNQLEGVPSLPPEEVPVNQSSMLCNDQGRQNMLVDNDVINDCIQQTTQFPPSFPQIMMEEVLPSSMDNDFNQLDVEKFMSGLILSPREEVLANQSSILCDDQAVQNILMVNDVDTIQQTTQFPTPFPDRTMTTMEGLDGTSSSCINQNGPNLPQTPSSDQQWTNQLAMSNQVPGMLPQPPMNQWFPQFPAHNLQVSTDYNVLHSYCSDSTLFEPTSSSRHQNSFIHQPQPGHVYMTQNATTSQHDGFNQPTPWIQCITNQGQVDQASVIPHIDNMQQESLVPRNVDRSTRSQMENLQVHALQNQIGRPNASNAGLDSSLQSQNRGLNTQQAKMVRQNDLFQKHVEDMNDRSKNCKFCGHSFAKGTSISRIKWHLSGERGHGVGICGQVPKEVQEAAFLAMRGGNKKHKSIPSSSNVNDYAISTCPQDNAVQGNLAGDAGRMQEHEMGIQEQAGTLEVDAHKSRGEAAQGTNVADQPFTPSVSNDVIMNDVQNMVRARTGLVEDHDVANSGRLVQPDAGARSSESLKCNKTRGVPFPTSSNKQVGQAFEENRKMIWSLLMNDEVSTIGIYGMGGVGKTTLMKHICNELRQRPDICDHVRWVTMSQDFSINRLQNLIAKRFDLDLSSEDDDLHRAAKLSEELRQKQKWILILDDLWNNFEPHDVGIHPSLKGCKLILTTRSQTICAQIDCQHKIKVKPLFEGESWTLFKENLGRHIALSDEVEGIAKAVARECAGLPLGIITIARSLRGVDDLPEWRTTLMKLRELKFRDMDEKVFKVLRVSYDRLDDGLALKQCLLYCALFPEDYSIEREKLIGYLIDEGIIKGMGRRQVELDEGHTMLNKLQNVCLLESDKTEDGGKYVKMHDLIRDMAIQIMQEKSQVIVKAGAQLEELPDAKEWTENLTRVSLMRNSFEEIPPSHSPIFTFRQIKTATNDFDAANKLGEGGFGCVYKGVLSDGTQIAVKQLSAKSKQGNREFVNEIGMISALQHPNLVRLYGCCIEGKQLLLVYEYMENNSLAHVLFGTKEIEATKLEWCTRQRICVNIAKGLVFLHEESTLKIVHRDIKGTNILLDKDMNAKISDFGMAKLDDEDNTQIETRVVGTMGYMAPEYALYGYLTDKADVYSFGVVALEIVSGMSNVKFRRDDDFVCLLDWVLYLQKNGDIMEMVDPRLGSAFNKKEVVRMVNVALLCTNQSPALRPTMSTVVSMLEGKTDVEELVMVPSTSSDQSGYATTTFNKFAQASFSGSSSEK